MRMSREMAVSEVNAAEDPAESLYVESGANCVRNVSGSFNVAWWEEKGESPGPRE